MGKRHVVIVSSSDDEEGDRSRSSNSSSSKSKSRPSVPRKNSTGSKRSRLSDCRTRSCKESSGVEEVGFDSFCEDFHESFTGFKVAPGSGRSDKKELWVDKYKPRSLAELAVHKKKVEEVKMWFEEGLRTSKEQFRNHALVITGQAGVGKSATIHVIASHLGATLYEWNTPTPTLWQEHIHNSNSGSLYTSKLDEFETFIEKIRKYGLLTSSFTEGSKTSAILLIDDLPLPHGKVAYGRLNNCLHILVRSTLIPTVILLTEYGKADSADNTTRYWEDLPLSLENAGACKVAFNPLTVNSIKKTLSRICRDEQFSVTAEQIDKIAKASGGDIRHAITSLQYFCLRPDPMLSLTLASRSTIHSRENADKIIPLDDGVSLSFGRDETLSLFHALGKFLHNKRETAYATGLGQDAFLLKERFTRLPLKMDAPEKVLCQAHGQVRPIADFLHENVLDFLSDEAMHDAWVVASYLSDADYLLASPVHGNTFPRMMSSKYESESVAQSAAASVAVRGVLFGNSHPSPSRWHAIRSPTLWQVERSSRCNKDQMVRQRFVAYNSLSSAGMLVMATEYTPMLKWLGLGAREGLQAHQKLMQGNKWEEDNCNRMSLDGLESETSVESEEDEIEDW